MINVLAERTPKRGPSSRGGLKANMIADPTSLLTAQNISFIPTTCKDHNDHGYAFSGEYQEVLERHALRQVESTTAPGGPRAVTSTGVLAKRANRP